MAMKKGLFLFRAAFLIVSFCMTSLPSLWAATTSSSSDCPSCSSFGVQRFPAKKEAPPFSLKALDGSSGTLSSWRGKPVLLFFWGTWCEACKEDIVLLQKFAEGKTDQISIFTVAVDGEREKKIRDIVKKLKVTLPTLMILKEKVIDTYEIRMIPMAVVIDQEGFMMGKIIGQRDWSKPEAWSVIKELCGLH
jgi:thiol-disulfide isomerase/thioredoxin